MPKIIGLVGMQLRRSLNEHRGYISADEISDAVYQASNTVFGHYAGHVALYRPGQPLPPRAYGLTEPLNVALQPFVREQLYSRTAVPNVLPISSTGVLLLPITPTTAALPVPGSFQRPVALLLPGARKVRAVNENAVATTAGNVLTRPSVKFPTHSAVPGGFQVQPVPASAVLRYLGAPPKCVFAEKPDPDEPLEMVYDDAASVDLGWTDVTAINEIIAHATRLLGGQAKDAQAVALATQTAQLGA